MNSYDWLRFSLILRIRCSVNGVFLRSWLDNVDNGFFIENLANYYSLNVVVYKRLS
jgi:hypothetical protein